MEIKKAFLLTNDPPSFMIELRGLNSIESLPKIETYQRFFEIVQIFKRSHGIELLSPRLGQVS
jgi:hypothetical protein